jgi:hypothetical protein
LECKIWSTREEVIPVQRNIAKFNDKKDQIANRQPGDHHHHQTGQAGWAKRERERGEFRKLPFSIFISTGCVFQLARANSAVKVQHNLPQPPPLHSLWRNSLLPHRVYVELYNNHATSSPCPKE